MKDIQCLKHDVLLGIFHNQPNGAAPDSFTLLLEPGLSLISEGENDQFYCHFSELSCSITKHSTAPDNLRDPGKVRD